MRSTSFGKDAAPPSARRLSAACSWITAAAPPKFIRYSIRPPITRTPARRRLTTVLQVHDLRAARRVDGDDEEVVELALVHLRDDIAAQFADQVGDAVGVAHDQHGLARVPLDLAFQVADGLLAHLPRLVRLHVEPHGVDGYIKQLR